MTGAEFLATHAWRLVFMAGLLAASAFFSGTETALFNLSPGQLHRLRHGGGSGGLVAALLRRPGRLLYSLLLANMIVNVAFGGTAATLVLHLQRQAPSWAAAAASFVPLLLLILIGEVTPKMLAFAVSERWSLLAAGPMTLIQRGLLPVLWVLEKGLVTPLVRIIAPRPRRQTVLSADELAAVLDLSAKRGIIDHDANDLIQEIVSLSDLRVGEIMVPRVDVAAFEVNGSRDELIDLFRRTRLRRILVYEEDIDHVIGVVHAKRLLLQPKRPVRDLVVPVPFVPETASVERLLHRLRQRRSQLAVVVDEYGGTAGVVLMRDALREIVGDLPDPSGRDRGPAVVELPDGRFLLDADLPIHELADALGVDLSGRRITTVGGFVTSLLGKIPQRGESATYGNLRFSVESVRGRRVGEIKIERTEEAA